MKVLRLALLVSVMSIPAMAQQWFKGSLDEALGAARSQKKLVLIDFYGID